METNEKISRYFAIVAGLLSLVAFMAYSWKTITGETHPNISSWAVWSFLTILNSSSYKKLTGDWAKSILPTANAVMTIITLGIALVTGTWQSLGVFDHTCLVLGMTAGIVWWINRTSKAVVAVQILLQIALIVGFIPTFKNAYYAPHSELWISWLIWTTCYAAQFYSVKYNWKGRYIEYLYPVNAGALHFIVFLLCLLR